MAEYRRFAGAATAVLSLSCGVHCFVAQTSSVSLRLRAEPLVAPGQGRTRSYAYSGNRRSGGNGGVRMRARRNDGEQESMEGMDRRQALSRAWKAAISLSTLGAVVAGVAPPAGAGIVEFLLPPQNLSKEIIVGEVDREISFDDFNRALLKGEVKKCEFFGANFDKAVVQLKDGTRALIGEGYPEEKAFSDDSPIKVVGLLRNAGVPYTTQFKMTAYSKPKSYKSFETLEAENRQRTEDQALERLMSDE